jgi:hypothetical protein
MAIQSVASSISAYANSGAQAAKSQQAQQPQQTQQVERSQPRPAERVELKEAAPHPVKNAQGQETGTLVNVTA